MPSLKFNAKAFKKTAALLAGFDTEVEWHGIVNRTDDGFVVEDILVFPHKASGAYVESDQKEYEAWLDTLPDEQFNALRMHGHSHVNMTPTPSGFDMTYRENILKNLPKAEFVDDVFYVFMIFNKSGKFTVQINDIKNGKLYVNKEVDVEFDTTGEYDTTEFLKNAKELVKPFIPKRTIEMIEMSPYEKAVKLLPILLYGDEEEAETAHAELWYLREREWEDEGYELTEELRILCP